MATATANLTFLLTIRNAVRSTRFLWLYKSSAPSPHSLASPPHPQLPTSASFSSSSNNNTSLLPPVWQHRSDRSAAPFAFEHSSHGTAAEMDTAVSCNGGGGSRLVVTELSLIKELVTQLEVHLAGSPDLCKHLTSQIFSLTERSIAMVTSADFDAGRKRSAADAGLASATPSPISDVVDAPFKTNKKRKMVEKRTHQVRVSPGGAGGEATTPVDDGHSWRKYGQKEILGAKHPRSYYRCTHRHTQGCAATKQVQRTDEDPELFDVFYHGTHTCVDKTVAGQAAQPPAHNPGARGLLHNLSASLTVKTEGLPAAAEPQGWSAAAPFRFSSTPVSGGGGLALEQSPFSAPSTSENWGVSPATSDSNHVASFPPFEAAAGGAEWMAQSELQEVMSILVAASTPPVLDDDFLNLDITSFFV